MNINERVAISANNNNNNIHNINYNKNIHKNNNNNKNINAIKVKIPNRANQKLISKSMLKTKFTKEIKETPEGSITIKTNNKNNNNKTTTTATRKLQSKTLSLSSSSSLLSSLSLSLSSLTTSVIERDRKSSVNMCFTNTNETNQLNLSAETSTTTTMPCRTTTKTTIIEKVPTTTTTTRIKTPPTTINKAMELGSKFFPTETSSNAIYTTKPQTTTTTKEKNLNSLLLLSSSPPIQPAAASSLPPPTPIRTITTSNSNSTTSIKTRFRRSYSVPILKIDDVSRLRMMNAGEFDCDKNLTTTTNTTKTIDQFKQFQKNGVNQFQQHQQQQLPQQQRKHQEKLLKENEIEKKFITDSYDVVETSSMTTPETASKFKHFINTNTNNNNNMSTTISPTPIPPSMTTSTDLDLVSVDIQHRDDQHPHHIREDQRFGCAHYKRRAMFVTPCCNKFYKCRFCHDENESHHFDRKTLNELICSECNTRQKVQKTCINCGVEFGKYTCLICNLFDDEDRKQYHCDACGICRIGGAENFFHCEVCNMCLPIQLKIDGHKCVENISRAHCPVCLGDIHTSRIPCHIPDCGHLLHKMCFDQLLASGHYTCPTCQTSLIDMTALWDFLDAQASKMPMPKKYENQRIHIFCNDCQKTSKTSFHFIGLKCMECGAYNTTQDVKRRVSLVPDEPNTA